MSSDIKDLEEFPNVEAKLQKPTKQSAFEKQKAEAKAKRQREAAETAAVYEDFVKSFDNDDDTNDTGRGDGFRGRGFASGATAAAAAAAASSALSQGRGSRPGFNAAQAGPGAGKRHFGPSMLKSGPGSLGPPPASLHKKRSFQDFARGSRDRSRLGFGDDDDDDDGHGEDAPKPSLRKAFHADDEDEEVEDGTNRAEEKAVARPTLKLANLPPGTSPSMIKTLMPQSMTVENVRILPPSGSMGQERKCAVAIVTLSQDTPANDIDSAVSSLQNQYLGFGHYLILHRHLSSAVATSATLQNIGATSSGTQPFGAKPVEQSEGPRDPQTQHGFRRGFAPPPSHPRRARCAVQRSANTRSTARWLSLPVDLWT